MVKKDIEFLCNLRCNRDMWFKVTFIFLVVLFLVKSVIAQETLSPTSTPVPVVATPTIMFDINTEVPTIPFSEKPDVGALVKQIENGGIEGTLHNKCVSKAKDFAILPMPNFNFPVIGGGINLVVGALNNVITPLLQQFAPSMVTSINQVRGNILCAPGLRPSNPENIDECICQDPLTYNLENLCVPLRWKVHRSQDIEIVKNDGKDGSDKDLLPWMAVVPNEQNAYRQLDNVPNQMLGTPAPTPATRLVERTDLKEYNACIACVKKGIWTGVGCVDISLPEFIQHKVFGYGLGLGGVLTMLGIIFSAFQIQISQGNPEKIKKAREMLTSFVIGLLVIIFSVFILRLIGVDLLRIPGFS
jgi:hypothetical protein